MTFEELCKQYYNTICQLDIRRKLLKEKLKQSNEQENCKELEKRIAILSEEIYEINEIVKFLEYRYGGGSLNDENI